MLYEIDIFKDVAPVNGSAATNGQQDMLALPDITSAEIYSSAKEQYLAASQTISLGDISSDKAIWADELCVRLLEFELMNEIPV